MTAKDKKNQTNSAKITIDSNKGRLSEEETNKIVVDAVWEVQGWRRKEDVAYQMRNTFWTNWKMRIEYRNGWKSGGYAPIFAAVSDVYFGNKKL